jgi:RNA polymerase sigma-70 factor (ECF subfamily)
MSAVIEPGRPRHNRRAGDRIARTEFMSRADALQHDRITTARFRRRGLVHDSEGDAAIISRAVACAKAGDREAVRYLYIRYAEHVYSYVATIVRDPHEAEDVTQHVFAKLMTALPKYEADRAPFPAWMLRVARNVAVDHLRQLRAIPCEVVHGEDRDADTADDERQRNLDLRQGLASLPDDQREVVVLRHVVGLSPSEISDRLGKTESSIHGLHNRGRGALRSVLAEMGSGPTTRAQAA